MTLEEMYPNRIPYEDLEKKAIDLMDELARALKRADIAESRVKELEARGLTLDAYQAGALRTIPEGTSTKDMLLIGALNLASEAGEVVNIIKKHVYHGHELDVDALEDELGDVQWPTAIIAYAIGTLLSVVGARNEAKLRRRYPNGFTEEASRNRAVAP